MPVNTTLAEKTWSRYALARDFGHTEFVEKAVACDNFFRGNQWKASDKQALDAARRPAMTINKIMPTILNVAGEQIMNRSEISFRPRGGVVNAPVAESLTKVVKQISDANQLDWVRSEVFVDGVITSRGFYDVRMDYSDNVTGDVRIKKLNSKNVLPDPDADEYDPDTWGDVMVTKWLTADDIEVLYSKADADILRNRDSQSFIYGYDAVDASRDRFGLKNLPLFAEGDMSEVLRDIRAIERQYRQLDRQKFFVERTTGEMRAVPEDFDRNRIALFTDTYGFGVTTKLVRRIRWVVVADNVVLHDEWSPYDHFTVVPYFPIFRNGHTVGYVENLLGPQEILNKVSSQELHIVNTTANSGYKVKAANLVNMTVEELEQKGAQTGVVIEVNDMEGLEKFTPNQVPQGLDRISYKAEEHLKSISGVPDAQTGFAREDVAAKAIEKNKQSAVTGLAKPFDNLVRTDHLLARAILCLVQKFYTDERIITITKNSVTGESESIVVNQVDPATSQIKNDLTLGEYDVVVTSVPHRETLEDSEFEQLVALREMSVQIPDTALIGASRVRNKQELLREMQGDQDSPEALAAKALQQRGAAAEVDKVEGEAAQKHADAQLKTVKAQKEAVTPPEQPQGADPADTVATLAGIERDNAQFEHERQMDVLELQRKRQKDQDDAQLKAMDLEQKRRDEMVRQAQQAAAAAQKPQPKQTA